MASIVFDTLKLAKRLQEGGFSQQQAIATAEAFAESVSDASGIATKADIAELRTELHRELSAMTWKVAALLLAQAASIVALLKLFP